MLQYQSKPNLLLEALAYLGRRTAGNTVPELLHRLEGRGVTDHRELDEHLAPLQALMDRLDAELPVAQAELEPLFGNLPGFPRNTIGSCSPAFLLFYPLASDFDGDADELADRLRRASREELAYRLAVCLDIAEDSESGSLDYTLFSTRVLAMQLPPESKVRLLELLLAPEAVISAAAPLLRQVLAILERSTAALDALCRDFEAQLRENGPEAFLSRTSGLNSGASCRLCPFLFGLDTNLSAFSSGGESTVYCGVFRRSLQTLLARKETPSEDVYETIRLLADRTRFDILCWLRDRTAYGQELSEHFGLSRNTIHHHMSKLLAARLVRCTVDGNRVYYTSDPAAVTALLQHQKALLLAEE